MKALALIASVMRLAIVRMMSSPHSGQSAVWPGGPSLNGPHAVGAFALCPQLHGFAHEMHLRPIIEKPRPFVGTLIHAGLAYRYGAMLPQKPEWLVYKDGYEAISVLGEHRPELRDLALYVFEAYERTYANNVWEPVLVEHQFIMPFEHGLYSARTDLLAIEWPAKEYVLIDHKFPGKLKSNYGNNFGSDRQMLTGLAMAHANGYPVSRVVINAGSQEMPNPIFARFDIKINQQFYDRLGLDTAHYIKMQQETFAAFPDPMNRPRNSEACLSKVYGICDYYGLCTGADGMHSFKVPDEYKHGRRAQGK
jgi:hypothetical protein